MIESHDKLKNEQFNSTQMAQTKLLEHSDGVLQPPSSRMFQWKGHTDREINRVDEEMVIPREKKSSYGNKFFIPGTTMRLRMDNNALPSSK